jgi:hypothetical protein
MSEGPALQYQIAKEHVSLLLYIQAIMSTRRLVAFINVNRNPSIYELLLSIIPGRTLKPVSLGICGQQKIIQEIQDTGR